MTVGGRLLEYRVLQLEVVDNAAGPEVEVLLDKLRQLLLVLGAARINAKLNNFATNSMINFRCKTLPCSR